MAQPAPSPSPEAAFATLPLFSSVPPEVRASFARQGRLHRYRAGTVMFLQGDPPDAVYCVLSGRVEITKTAADGRVRILGATGRSGSAICVTDTTAWAIDGQQFLRFLTAHPPVALTLLSSLSRLVITQNGLVDDMLFLDLKGRVAKRLLELATTSWHAPPGDGTVVDWGLPQADLAYLRRHPSQRQPCPVRIRPSRIDRTLRPPVHPAQRRHPAPACRALSHQRTTTSRARYQLPL